MAASPAVAVPATATFLGVPGEIREHILLQLVKGERAGYAMAIDDTSAPQKYDFSVNANGFWCHSMKSFGVLFVSKQVHLESLAVLYKNSSVVLYAEITHDARAFGFIPNVLNNIPLAMKASVQTVGVKFLNIATAHVASLSSNQNIPRERAGRRNLVAVVDTIINEFPQRKSLHISAGVNGAKLDDLKALFELFTVKDKLITLDELWQLDGVTYRPAWYNLNNFRNDNVGKKMLYEKLAKQAAAEIGQEWFQKAKAPILSEEKRTWSGPFASSILYPYPTFPSVTTWRGSSVCFARRRVWKRESTTAPTVEMAAYLKERVYSSSPVEES
ncbi:hypothetical protein BKA65DRAFT_548587 [Rhexocercosporidium sp. MPI-PUGE-AT-0058]|nr:hypothetical protein BKA65DRAFT_548587 [Rhexocercosporidium sp. MPI-PUGE-AT-0058]